MALREFNGEDGREWHVWDITPEKMHPSTRAEDYLQGVLEGWLVFEAADGQGKARLYPIPADWATSSEEELRAMLLRADLVREAADRKSGPTRLGAIQTVTSAARSGANTTDHEVGRSGNPATDVRTFRYPGGRVWTVAERAVADQAEGESRVALRFSSGSRNLDLLNFPVDWMRGSDDELIDLLCVAFPRPSADGQDAGTQHRRRGDTTRS